MNEISATVNDKFLYQKEIETFKTQLKVNAVFKEFEQFLLTKIAIDALFDASEKELENEQILIEKILVIIASLIY